MGTKISIVMACLDAIMHDPENEIPVYTNYIDKHACFSCQITSEDDDILTCKSFDFILSHTCLVN